MTEQELREKIGIKENELVNTNMGALDIFDVKDDIVYFGFLAFGDVMKEPIKDFISKFD